MFTRFEKLRIRKLSLEILVNGTFNYTKNCQRCLDLKMGLSYVKSLLKVIKNILGIN